MGGEQRTETLWQASTRWIEKAATAIFSGINLISSHICFLVQYSPQEWNKKSPVISWLLTQDNYFFIYLVLVVLGFLKMFIFKIELLIMCVWV